MLKKILLSSVFLFLFFPVVAFAEQSCNQWASSGEAVCITKTYQGYKCAWDVNKKGGARCYKSDKKAATSSSTPSTGGSTGTVTTPIPSLPTSCTEIDDSSTCQSSKVDGHECIWRQGACFDAFSDGTDETIIADDPTDRTEQETVNKDPLSPQNTILEDRIDDFINNKIGASGTCTDGDQTCMTNQEKLYTEAKQIWLICDQVFDNFSFSSSDTKHSKCSSFITKMNWYAENGYFGNRVILNFGEGCIETLGALGTWLSKIYKILLLAVPVIIVVLGIKDFIQAQTSNKADDLKKMFSTFIKRLIFGAIFIALPMAIKTILVISLGGDVADMCIF